MFVILAAVLLAIDQLTKLWVVNTLPYMVSLPILGNFFQLTYIHNTGAAFSLFAEHTGFLALFALVAVCGFGFVWWKTPKEQKLQRACFALIVAGALGNVLDRVRLGYVVDFFQLPHWPIFNVADICLVVGVGLLCISLLREIFADMKKNKGK